MDKLDILNRDKFVEQLVRLIENISDNKTSTCFAINGAWGCGKSFVLDMFEEQLNGPYSEKYFVVRYNCWKYDYYEEPLIAIVSSIIAEIDEKVNFLPDSQEKQEILGMFKATGTALLSIANEMVKSKIGVDFLDSYEKVKEGEKTGSEKYDKEHSYDTYLDLNKVIDKLSDLLADIAQEYTVVIIVDELDRCVPDYAIKVLERLHHLTEEKKNIITVVAIDKQQLESSVKQLFGFDDASKYLEKFFNFEIELDKGKVSEKITEKYADYITLFDKDIIPFPESIDECIQAIFTGIDARMQEKIMKKVMLVHNLLYDEKKDYSFMCVELLIAVMTIVYNYRYIGSKFYLNSNNVTNIFIPHENSPKPEFNEFFKNKFDRTEFRISREVNGESIFYGLPEKVNLYAAIAFIWRYLHAGSDTLYFQAPRACGYEPMRESADALKTFYETLKMIK